MSREDDTDREDERLGSSDASTGRWIPVIPPQLVTSGPPSDTTPEEATPPQRVTSDAADGQTSPQNEPVRRIDKTYDDIGLSTLEGATVRGPRRVQAPAIYVAMIVVTVGFGIVIAANLVALARHPDLTTWLGPEREVLVNSLIVAILVYVACMIALVALLRREPDPRAYSLLVAPSGWIIPFEIIVIGGVGLQDMGAFDVIYFGVGVLCVTWVACLWRVKVDPEPDIPSPALEGHGTSAGSDGAAAVDAELAPSVPPTPVVRRLVDPLAGTDAARRRRPASRS
jgi:hypothetical protein